MDSTRPPLADEDILDVAAGMPPMSGREVTACAARIPEWTVVERREVMRLERVFQTPNWQAGLDFATRIGALAAEANHHPAILLEWGRVTVTWWTLRVRGLHRNDFVMAARTDRLWESVSWKPSNTARRPTFDGPGD